MNLKKSVLSFMAAGTMLVGGMSAAIAQEYDGTTEAKVTVANTGQFDVQFCADSTEAVINSQGVDFETVDVTTAEDGSADGWLIVCYLDTGYRPNVMNTKLRADDFQLQGTGTGTIDAENLRVSGVHFVNSGRWNSATDGITGVGSISGRAGAPGSANQVTRANSPRPVANGINMETGVLISVLNAGSGTGGDFYLSQDDAGNPGTNYQFDARSSAGSWQRVDLELTVPAGTTPGTYTTEITVDVGSGI